MTKQEIADKIADLASELWELERFQIRDFYTDGPDKVVMRHTSQTLLSMSDTLDTLAELINSTL